MSAEPPAPTDDAEPSPGERLSNLIQTGRFTEAARLYSDLTGANLIDSKLAVDRLAARHGHAPLYGCVSHLAIVAAIACGFAAVVCRAIG